VARTLYFAGVFSHGSWSKSLYSLSEKSAVARPFLAILSVLESPVAFRRPRLATSLVGILTAPCSFFAFRVLISCHVRPLINASFNSEFSLRTVYVPTPPYAIECFFFAESSNSNSLSSFSVLTAGYGLNGTHRQNLELSAPNFFPPPHSGSPLWLTPHLVTPPSALIFPLSGLTVRLSFLYLFYPCPPHQQPTARLTSSWLFPNPHVIWKTPFFRIPSQIARAGTGFQKKSLPSQRFPPAPFFLFLGFTPFSSSPQPYTSWL